MEPDMNRKEAGFSLIELVVTLSVLAIILAIALPSFAAMLQGSRASSTYHLLTTSLAAARLRAIKDNAPITVCPSIDGRTCRGDTIWSDGWILYQDPGHDEQPRTEAMVIQRFEGVDDGLRLRSTAGRTRVRFLPTGWAFGSNLSLRLCRAAENEFLGSVIVNNAGRPRTERQHGSTPCPFTVQARR
jgi:type IV fimbrial biogenesis protein FimT